MFALGTFLTNVKLGAKVVKLPQIWRGRQYSLADLVFPFSPSKGLPKHLSSVNIMLNNSMKPISETDAATDVTKKGEHFDEGISVGKKC